MILEHWLSIGAGVFLVGMMLYGHYRGLLKQCVSLGALILTIIIVKLAAPYVTDFLKENPSIRLKAGNAILSAAGWESLEESQVSPPSAQRLSIEKMNLPESVKEILLENNNSEIYHMLGVNQFTEYISAYLADMLISAVVSAVLFMIVFILVHLAVRWLDIIARLPIIHGLNHMAGAAVGFAYGFLLLWLSLFLLKLFSATPMGGMLMEQVNHSSWLTFLYQYNIISILLGGVMKGIF